MHTAAHDSSYVHQFILSCITNAATSAIELWRVMFVAAPVGQFPGTPGFNPSTFWDVSQAATQAAPVQARFRLPPLGMTLSLLYVAVIWLNAREAIGQLHTTTTAAAAAAAQCRGLGESAAAAVAAAAVAHQQCTLELFHPHGCPEPHEQWIARLQAW